jgi:hypothetical protein
MQDAREKKLKNSLTNFISISTFQHQPIAPFSRGMLQLSQKPDRQILNQNVIQKNETLRILFLLLENHMKLFSLS